MPSRSVAGRAFTLIELMIVVAIIAIIAAIAIPNLVRSRMAANESAAIAACRAFGTAQEVYHRTDWDDDGVLEYSAIVDGANSLYTQDPATPGDVALVDTAFARATGSPLTAFPKAGYVFAVLTGQGSLVPGGSKSYFSGTNMNMGYGLSAVPVNWDGTARNTFQINMAGTVYQKDRGSANTAHLTTYNPDSTWAVSE